MKPFIGIKKIWTGAPFTADATPSAISTWLATANRVTNSHEGTWGYTQDDPSTTDYVNELNGKIYYRDKTSEGAKTITFTMGVYEFAQLAELAGGEVINSGTGADATTIGWRSDAANANEDEGLTIVNKAVVAQTKTGNWIVFTNAAIVAKKDQQEKNIGLGVSAICMESEYKASGVAAEYMYNDTAITLPQG